MTLKQGDLATIEQKHINSGRYINGAEKLVLKLESNPKNADYVDVKIVKMLERLPDDFPVSVGSKFSIRTEFLKPYAKNLLLEISKVLDK